MKIIGANILKQTIECETLPANNKLQVSRLPFSGIPPQSRLFTEYLRDPVSLKNFYPNAIEKPTQIASFISTVLADYTTDRGELCDALAEINSNIGAGKKTNENIRLLRDVDTVAVVTGQQAGLFTGPLYTVYKALSAVKMAEMLNKNGSKAVPVFWTATEDHDFDEVSEAYFIGKAGNVFRSAYLPDGYVMDSPVGSVTIDSEINHLIGEIFEELPETEFSGELKNLLHHTWSPGTRFGDAFEKTLALILGRFGIIFIDPMNERIKRLCGPIYINAIQKTDEIAAAVIGRSRELERGGFHAQVLVEEDYFPLFWHDDAGRRKALRKAGDGVYRVKGDMREFSLSELAGIAATEPQRFSPGVMLRPVVQDYLLPAVCYFGGGAEIAYFAQNSEVYRVLDRPVTPVFHRQSFTIIESKHRRVFEKLDLDFSQLFDGVEGTMLRLAEERLSPDTSRLFAEVEERINTELNRLDENVSPIDPTLAEYLTKRRRKMLYHIAALKKKTLLARTRQDETLSRQIDNLFTALLPKGQLQERHLNVFSFLNKFGLNFIDWIYESIDLDDKTHRIVEL
ncbi:MAG: bacillithiol biosynthesis cysteine-adding enzyme BshC [Pyrinomonadaceae bacterium]